jgi:hypothetical protein
MQRLSPAALAIAALLAIGSLPRPTAASEVLTSGEGLLEACNELEQGIRPAGVGLVSIVGRGAEMCWTFIGAMQQVSVFTDASDRPYLEACPPPASSLSQLVRVFTTFATAHPEYLHPSSCAAVLFYG